MTTEPSGDSRGVEDSLERQPPSEVLQRWEDCGAVWRVVSRTNCGVTVALCRCDGGEEVQLLTSDDPELYAWLAGRASSEQVRRTDVS